MICRNCGSAVGLFAAASATALSIAGTKPAAVTPSSRISISAAPGSNIGSTTIVAPTSM